MYISVKLHLNVDERLEKDLLEYETAFKKEVERICNLFIDQGRSFEYPYRNFDRSISYNSKHLVLSCAKEMYQKKEDNMKYTYGFSSYWSNSSYTVVGDILKLELGPKMYRDRLLVPIFPNEHALMRVASGKPMNMKILCRNHKWTALLYVECEPVSSKSNKAMGIDIGVKVPAVTAIEKNHIKFFGNGREIRFIQRKYRSHIIAMQKRKQFKKLVQFEHKLSHILKEIDHKISKDIITYACEHNIGIIKMENLVAINRKFKVQHNPNIYLWSYRRLQEYIAYKATLQGIKVIYVNPYHTSQKCPLCGKLNHANDRYYVCTCGYKNHRDAVAAMNVLNAL